MGNGCIEKVDPILVDSTTISRNEMQDVAQDASSPKKLSNSGYSNLFMEGNQSKKPSSFGNPKSTLEGKNKMLSSFISSHQGRADG